VACGFDNNRNPPGLAPVACGFDNYEDEEPWNDASG
jgi:hypothetical protein